MEGLGEFVARLENEKDDGSIVAIRGTFEESGLGCCCNADACCTKERLFEFWMIEEEAVLVGSNCMRRRLGRKKRASLIRKSDHNKSIRYTLGLN